MNQARFFQGLVLLMHRLGGNENICIVVYLCNIRLVHLFALPIRTHSRSSFIVSEFNSQPILLLLPNRFSGW